VQIERWIDCLEVLDWLGYRTFSVAPIASQTVAVSIREFGFEEVTERN